MLLGAQLAFQLGAPPAIFVAPAPFLVPGPGGGMPADYLSASNTPIVVDVPGAPSSLTITAILLGRGSEVVYASGAFTANYSVRSTAVAAPAAEGTGSTRFSILRFVASAVAPAPSGWPGAGAISRNGVQILVQRVDSGSATSAIASWQMPAAAGVASAPAPATFPVAVNIATEITGHLISQFRSQH